MNYKTYLFDFDYTLADSSRGIVKCFRIVLTRHQYLTVTDEAIKRTIRQNIGRIFQYSYRNHRPNTTRSFPTGIQIGSRCTHECEHPAFPRHVIYTERAEETECPVSELSLLNTDLGY